MPKENAQDKIKLSRKTLKVSLLVSGLVILAVVGVFFAYAYSYSNKVLLNSRVLTKNVSGYSRQQLKDYIENSTKDSNAKKIRIVYQDKSWELTFENAAYKIDSDKTINQIFDYGHSGNDWQNVLSLVKSVFKNNNFELVYSFNESTTLDWLNTINDEIGKPKAETNIVIKNNEAKITDSQVGQKINDDEVKDEILRQFALKSTGDITVKIIEDKPTITKEEAQGLVDQAKKLVANDIELAGPAGKVSWDKNYLGSIIELRRKEKKSFIKSSKLGEVYISFEDAKIKSQLQKDSETLNTPAKDAKFTISNGQISLQSTSAVGREVILDEAVKLIIAELEKGTNSKIQLPSRDQQPSISGQSAADIAKIGIKELIATGTTDFRKSPQNRIHNIQTGMQYISGAIIKPGDEFSTIGRLGAIDQSGGYLPELVIKENKTIPEFGGGLCQVSTTLFRATMNAGLQITARQNHSYRVSYYEPPVGMDATIYSPAPDFKFVNNTPGYILIYGHIEGTKITFDIYGTKDNRQVSITDPVMYDVTNPPEPIYTDDPTLAPGEVKQTDHAHAGAKAYFYYKVTKDGKEIINDKFTSSYVAWPAKYSRGPQVAADPAQPQTAPAPATATPEATTTPAQPPTP
jgi:vancomycin resistance protein YoaR